MTKTTSFIVGLFLFASLIHCSSGTTGGGTGTASSASTSACETVCNCVASNGGDATTCMSQCSSVAASSTNPKDDCESELKSRGYSTCEDSCNAFTTKPSTGSGSGSNGLAPFCAKCASCVTDPSFDEGFCTPFKTSGGGFDEAACTANGDVAKLASPNLSASQLDALSCAAFDDAE